MSDFWDPENSPRGIALALERAMPGASTVERLGVERRNQFRARMDSDAHYHAAMKFINRGEWFAAGMLLYRVDGWEGDFAVMPKLHFSHGGQTDAEHIIQPRADQLAREYAELLEQWETYRLAAIELIEQGQIAAAEETLAHLPFWNGRIDQIPEQYLSRNFSLDT